ncbi:class I tRNA ligase family protein [Candidatus Hodgkinia cicadicola]
MQVYSDLFKLFFIFIKAINFSYLIFGLNNIIHPKLELNNNNNNFSNKFNKFNKKFNFNNKFNFINKYNENSLAYQASNRPKDITLINRAKFNLLDGPPYANGELHLGHLLNKLLKNYCASAQEALGRSPKIKSNWDCHGLPVEHCVKSYLEKNKVKSKALIAFACRIYSLNWAKVQALQLKMMGIKSYKRKTTACKNSKKETLNKVYNLIKLGAITHGRKYTTWILSKKTSIPDNELKKVFTKSAKADVTYLISKRLQIKSCPTQTLIPLLEGVISKHIKLFNKNVKINNVDIWSMPWATHVCIPNNGLKIISQKGKYSITCKNYKPNYKLSKQDTIKNVPSQIIKQANLLNIFNSRSIPIISDKIKNIKIIDCTTENNKYIKFSPIQTNFLRYNKSRFNKKTINTKSNSYTTGELYVINKLLTCSLISKCYYIPKSTTISIRSKDLAIKCITPQWYIKLNYIKKQAICNYINNWIKFKPEFYKKQLIKLILTRPEWIISRQITWGIPICVIRNKDNKIIYDDKIMKRINNLLVNNKEFNWETVNILYPPYNKKNWKKDNSILDVWFDSSMMYELRKSSNQPTWHLALEGPDQHRGWFQATMINSFLSKGKLPIKSIITHPFIMISKDQKMSKSKTGIWASNLLKLNPNIIRLWAANTNLLENKVIEDNWLLKATSNYTKIYNLLKWALESSNESIYSNDYINNNDHVILIPELLSMRDRFMLHRLLIWSHRMIRHYKSYSFNIIIDNINIICNELSTQYINPCKDILYCDFQYSALRINCLFIIKCWLTQIVKWLNPIIPIRHSHIAKALKIDNYVLNTMPSNWYNKFVARQWRIIDIICKVVSSLDIKHDERLTDIHILVQDFSVLKWFTNFNINSIFNNTRVNILLVKDITNSAKISPYIGLRFSTEQQSPCSRCKGVLVI